MQPGKDSILKLYKEKCWANHYTLTIFIGHPKKTWNFNTTLVKLEKNNKEVILAGDFNIDLLKLNEKNIISEYFDMITNNSFYPKITVPTRLTNNHGKLINKFLCKLSENTLDTTSGVLTKKLSDYQPYFIVLNNVLIKDSPPVHVKITKQDNQAIQNFHNEILNSYKLINLKIT